ncbi:MAG: sulfotransferase domain-containing protein [Trichodesmium sp. St18_bin1]|nr:sulfotransferase domain-containing protein [Trichodesmium sp. St18_bin1]
MEKINVIWIASYPKSGNTWMNSIIRQASIDRGFVQGEMDVHVILRESKTPNVFHLVKPSYAKHPCSVLKTHSLYKQGDNLHKFTGFQLINTGFIHIFRNPLDVLLSYINYTRLQYRNLVRRSSSDQRVTNYRKLLFIDTLGFDKAYDVNEWEKMSLETIPQKNLDYSLDSFSNNGLSIPAFKSSSGTWIEHITSWKKAKADISGFSVRYEDCLNNPNEFFHLLEFFDFSQTNISDALNRVNIRAREESSSNSIFYNKMQAYYFFDYFSRSAITRFFNKHENTLKNFDYECLLEKI